MPRRVERSRSRFTCVIRAASTTGIAPATGPPAPPIFPSPWLCSFIPVSFCRPALAAVPVARHRARPYDKQRPIPTGDRHGPAVRHPFPRQTLAHHRHDDPRGELRPPGRDIIGLARASPISTRPTISARPPTRAIDAGHTQYTAPTASPELKRAICAKFARENGLDYAPAQVTVGTGGKQVLFNALMATLNPGDEVRHPGPLLGELSRHRAAGRRHAGDRRGRDRRPASSMTPRAAGGRDHAADQMADLQLAVEPHRRGLFAGPSWRR